MSLKIILILLALSGVAGIAFGYVLRVLIGLATRGSVELEIKRKTLAAKEAAARILADAEYRADVLETERLAAVEEREEKVSLREERVAARETFLDERQRDLDAKGEAVKAREDEAREARRAAEDLIKERTRILEQAAHLSEMEAREELVKEAERASEDAILLRLQKLEAHGRARLEEKARAILTTAVHRLANAVNADMTSLSVAIPSDEVKGKIIGREGRNIKAFERATGMSESGAVNPRLLAVLGSQPV
jgi:ribonuclease Y